MNQTLSTSLANPATDTTPFVLIEQEEWSGAVGRVTIAAGIQNVGAAIFGGSYADKNCGGDEEVEAKLYIYPTSGLRYELAISWGSLTFVKSETVERDELKQCSLQESIKLDYPPTGPVWLEWMGECYDENGNIAPNPATTVKGADIFLNKQIYGTLRCCYKVARQVYSFVIPERPDAIENSFQAVAVARWNGGMNLQEISTPVNFEETKGACGNGSSTTINPDDDEETEEQEEEVCKHGTTKHKFPVSVTADRHLLINYCKQFVITNETEEEIEYEQRCSQYAPDYLI